MGDYTADKHLNSQIYRRGDSLKANEKDFHNLIWFCWPLNERNRLVSFRGSYAHIILRLFISLYASTRHRTKRRNQSREHVGWCENLFSKLLFVLQRGVQDTHVCRRCFADNVQSNEREKRKWENTQFRIAKRSAYLSVDWFMVTTTWFAALRLRCVYSNYYRKLQWQTNEFRVVDKIK